jgi:hypothetical protein
MMGLKFVFVNPNVVMLFLFTVEKLDMISLIVCDYMAKFLA